jgi:AsmA protein
VKFDVRSGAALSRWSGGNPQTLARFDGAELSGRLEVSHQELVLSEGKIAAPGAEGGLSVFADFDGNIRATIDDLALHGGQARGKLSIDARQREAVLAGSFQMNGVDSLSLTQGVSGFDWLSGRADASVEIAGGGKTPEELAATMSGKARLSLANGALEGLDLPLIVAKARDGELGNWRREAGRRTPFDRFEANFTIANGIAETKDLTLSGPNIAVTGEGTTDIPRQRLDYRLKTKVTARAEQPAANAATPAPADEASLTMPLIIKGDWDKPEIRPDVTNALKDKEALAGTAKLLGKSVEKYTDGKIKAEDFGKAIDSIFGKKKKKHRDEEGEKPPQ